MLYEFSELLVSDVFIGVPSVYEYQGHCCAPAHQKKGEEEKENYLNVQFVSIVVLAFRMLLLLIFMSFSSEIKVVFGFINSNYTCGVLNADIFPYTATILWPLQSMMNHDLCFIVSKQYKPEGLGFSSRCN
jgi:hypothetical protein